MKEISISLRKIRYLISNKISFFSPWGSSYKLYLDNNIYNEYSYILSHPLYKYIQTLRYYS